MVVGDEDRPAALGRRPRDGEVAAEVDEDAGSRSRGTRLRGAVGGERLGRGAEVDLDAGGHADTPVLVVDLDAPPARGRNELDVHGLAAGHDDARSPRPSRARASSPPTVGSTSPSVISAARTPAASASRSSRLADVHAPALRASRETSESERKRLQARSIASSSRSRRQSSASQSASGSTVVISAVVPSAVNRAVANCMLRFHPTRMRRP